MQDDPQASDGEYHDTYATVATNCIRHFGMGFDEIDRLTLPEYELMMNAHALAEIDKDYDRHVRAWLDVVAGATKKDGRPVYKKFSDFFDYEKELKRATKKPDPKFSNLSKHLKEKEKCNRK